MEIKTSQSYQKEVLERYKSEKGGEMRGYLAEPTRRQIREACIALIGKRNSTYDKQTLSRFFQFEEGENRILQIQRFKADKFVPVVKFLKGEVQRTSPENIELISWLINFQPRPLQEYLKPEKNIIIKEGDINSNSEGSDNRNPIGFTENQDENKEKESLVGIEREKGEEEKKKKKRRWIIIISISFAFGAILINTPRIKELLFKPSTVTTTPKGCMTWVDSLYVEVSCDLGPFSKHGTAVKSLDPTELKSMKKVEVDAAYPFFSEDGKPLVWYYKNKKGEHEYFTAPGFHPITNETLKKITPYIIQTYVPTHLDNKESFVPE